MSEYKALERDSALEPWHGWLCDHTRTLGMATRAYIAQLARLAIWTERARADAAERELERILRLWKITPHDRTLIQALDRADTAEQRLKELEEALRAGAEQGETKSIRSWCFLALAERGIDPFALAAGGATRPGGESVTGIGFGVVSPREWARIVARDWRGFARQPRAFARGTFLVLAAAYLEWRARSPHWGGGIP